MREIKQEVIVIDVNDLPPADHPLLERANEIAARLNNPASIKFEPGNHTPAGTTEQSSREIYKRYRSSDTKCQRGFVYLLKDAEGMGFYKIGSSDHPPKVKRLVEVQCKLPFECEVVHYFPSEDRRHVEIYFQKAFQASHKRGEWFKLNEQQIAFFRSFERADSPEEVRAALEKMAA